MQALGHASEDVTQVTLAEREVVKRTRKTLERRHILHEGQHGDAEALQHSHACDNGEHRSIVRREPCREECNVGKSAILRTEPWCNAGKGVMGVNTRRNNTGLPRARFTSALAEGISYTECSCKSIN